MIINRFICSTFTVSAADITALIRIKLLIIRYFKLFGSCCFMKAKTLAGGKDNEIDYVNNQEFEVDANEDAVEV